MSFDLIEGQNVIQYYINILESRVYYFWTYTNFLPVIMF